MRSRATSREPALDQPFWGMRSLAVLRRVVAAHGAALGLAGERLQALVVSIHELAANAVRHAGGGGRLRLWREKNMVYGQVADRGPGMPDADAVSAREPSVQQEGGRGLFSVRRLADRVDFYNSGSGMVITISVAVDDTATCS